MQPTTRTEPPDRPPIRVAHVIPDLAIGGAETALVRLLEGLDGARFASLVVTLRDGGELVERARRAGVRVVSLGMRTRLPSPLTLRRLRAALVPFAPDVVQGWMYHGNLAAWTATRLVQPRPALAWNVRQSLAGLDHERGLTRLVIRANARLSSAADAIVNNSRASATQHADRGFDARRVEIIPNGFDTDVFRPDEEARAEVRAQLGIAPGSLVAGMVARFDPVKLHDLFLYAFARARRDGLDVHALLVGSGIVQENAALARRITRERLDESVHLLGARHDVARLLPALDVLVSASWTEGFPNAVGEAMACGVPCVVTDTGDCAAMVGDAGVVVPPGDGAALARALPEMLRRPAHERSAMGARGRARIAADYTLAACTARYAALYAKLATSPARASDEPG